MSAIMDRPVYTQEGITETIEARSGERPSERPDSRVAARGKPSRGRLIAFYVVTGVTGVLLSALGLSSVEWPWYAPAQPFLGMRVEAHRWHGAEFAALLAILLGGSLLALLWQPERKPLLAQYLILSGALITVLFEVFAGTQALALGAPIVVIAALYPNWQALLDARPRERWSRSLTALSAVAAALLIQPTWVALSYQILYPYSEHAEHYHWVAAAALALSLALGGLLAATRRPGWRILTALVGVAYAYLGLAAIAAPTHAGSWGVAGGVLAAVAGALYLALLPGRQPAWYADGTGV